MAGALPFGVDAGMDSNPAPDRGERDIWGATILFGPVVFPLVGTAVTGLLDVLYLAAPNTHQLWPYRASFTWRPRPGLDDLAVMRLSDEYLARVLALSTGTARPSSTRRSGPGR